MHQLYSHVSSVKVLPFFSLRLFINRNTKISTTIVITARSSTTTMGTAIAAAGLSLDELLAVNKSADL